VFAKKPNSTLITKLKVRSTQRTILTVEVDDIQLNDKKTTQQITRIVGNARPGMSGRSETLSAEVYVINKNELNFQTKYLQLEVGEKTKNLNQSVTCTIL
jgi:hypothetical protein